VERVDDALNIASFVYVLAGAVAAPLILLPLPGPRPVIGLTLIAIPAVLLLKYGLGYPIGGPSLPLTVTEICAVLVTIQLAHHLGRNLEESRQSVVNALVSHLEDNSRPSGDGLQEIYREVRRARSHGRPLTLLALAPTDDSVNISLDRFTKEIQQTTLRHYAQAKLGELLTAGAKSSDIIARNHDHFVMLLPETGRHKANRLIRKLRASARSALGLELAVGASVFPEDEVTFVKLMERARARMDRGEAADIAARPNGTIVPQRERPRTRTDGDKGPLAELAQHRHNGGRSPRSAPMTPAAPATDDGAASSLTRASSLDRS
jgi:hypothetical protein